MPTDDAAMATPARPTLRCPNCGGTDPHRFYIWHPAWFHADDMTRAKDVEIDPMPGDTSEVECRHVCELKGGGTTICGYRAKLAEMALAATWREFDDAVAAAADESEASADRCFDEGATEKRRD